MKLFFIILCQVFILSVYAQDDKPRYYYDENDSRISGEIYKEKINLKENQYKYIKYNFENDTCFISLIIKRKNYGRLKQEDFNSLKKSLADNIYESKNRYSVILYHPGGDICNNYSANVRSDKIDIFKKGYLKKLNKALGLKNYWIHKNDSNINYQDVKSVDWRLDKNQTVEKLFFRFHYPCHSFVIVDNVTKNYISYFSEYSSSNLVSVTKELVNLTN